MFIIIYLFIFIIIFLIKNYSLTPDWLIFQKEAEEKELETKFDFHIAKVECTESEGNEIQFRFIIYLY